MNSTLKIVLIICAGLPLLVILAMPFFNRKRMKEQEGKREKQLASLNINDRVVTISGIYGSIKGIEKNIVKLEVAKGIVIEIDKASVMGALK
ncbi:MAG: preprotein translocase subunit YajC [Clostridium sp.]